MFRTMSAPTGQPPAASLPTNSPTSVDSLRLPAALNRPHHARHVPTQRTQRARSILPITRQLFASCSGVSDLASPRKFAVLAVKLLAEPKFEANLASDRRALAALRIGAGPGLADRLVHFPCFTVVEGLVMGLPLTLP